MSDPIAGRIRLHWLRACCFRREFDTSLHLRAHKRLTRLQATNYKQQASARATPEVYRRHRRNVWSRNVSRNVCSNQLKPRPTTRHGEDTGVQSCIQQSGRAGPSTGGCLPRIHLCDERHLEQPNGTARSALSDAWYDILTIVLNPATQRTAESEFAQLRVIPIQ